MSTDWKIIEIRIIGRHLFFLFVGRGATLFLRRVEGRVGSGGGGGGG